MPSRFLRWSYVLVLGVCLCVPTTLVAQPAPGSPSALARAVEAELADSLFSNAWWGIVVLDLDRNRVLYEQHADKSFVPASNTKLYTTAAALEQLGPDYRYRTILYADGPVVNGTLEGNLIVRGSGDPVIGGRFSDDDRTAVFRSWADSLRALGITHVAGDIIGDDDVFNDASLGYGWSWNDLSYWYAAEVSGLSFNDNNVDFVIQGQRPGEPAKVRWEPFNTSYVQVVNRTLTTPSGTTLDEGYARNPGTNVIVLSSRVPEGQVDYESLTVANPTLFFVHVFRETLLREGIAVSGRTVDVDDLSIKPDYGAPHLYRVATHTSVPLSEIVSVVNERSQNLYAEQVLRTLAAENPLPPDTLVVMDDDLEPGSAEVGLRAAMETFVRAGVDTSRIELVDGSGLSRLNLVTPRMTAALLSYMWHHPHPNVRSAFLESLPAGGVDGTLQHRFPGGSVAHGRVRAKTGTLSNVSALSGYIRSAGGTSLAFVLMTNHHTVDGDDVRAAQDRIVEVLARYRN